MNDQQVPSRRERRREKTRQALLASARDLFTQRGIHRTRVQDITDAADLGKGAFYNYFDSKYELIAELLSEAIELLQRRYLAGLNGEPSAARRAVAISRQHALFFEEHPSYLLLFHQARALVQLHPRGAARLRRVFAEYLAELGSQLLPEAERLRWPVSERMDLAAVTVGVITGYRSFQIASGLPASRRTAEEVLAGGVPQLLRSRDAPDGRTDRAD